MSCDPVDGFGEPRASVLEVLANHENGLRNMIRVLRAQLTNTRAELAAERKAHQELSHLYSQRTVEMALLLTDYKMLAQDLRVPLSDALRRGHGLPLALPTTPGMLQRLETLALLLRVCCAYPSETLCAVVQRVSEHAASRGGSPCADVHFHDALQDEEAMAKLFPAFEEADADAPKDGAR